MKTRLFLFLLITFQMSISCSSDKDSDTPSIVGNWTLYKVETDGYYDSLCNRDCATMVYKSDLTCIYSISPMLFATIYKVDGKFIEHYNISTGKLERTDEIVSLTIDEMRIRGAYAGVLDILVFKRDK